MEAGDGCPGEVAGGGMSVGSLKGGAEGGWAVGLGG